MTGIAVLSTERLMLRGWNEQGVDRLNEIYADPEVNRLLPGTLTEGPQHTTLDRIHATWEQHAFGSWAVEQRQTGRIIGAVGLSFPGHWPQPEISWVVEPVSWGHGFAAEGAAAALRYGLEVCELQSIISVCLPPKIFARCG